MAVPVTREAPPPPASVTGGTFLHPVATAFGYKRPTITTSARPIATTRALPPAPSTAPATSTTSSAPSAGAQPSTAPAPSASTGEAHATRPISFGVLADDRPRVVPTSTPDRTVIQDRVQAELPPAPAAGGTAAGMGSALWLILLVVVLLLALR